MPGSNRLRITVIGRLFVVPSNRARWERVAERHPDMDVTLIAPATFWTDRYGTEQSFRATGEERENYRVLPFATTDRGLYRSLTLGMRGTHPHVVQVNDEPTEWDLFQSFLVARLLAPHALRFFCYYTNVLSTPDTWYRKAKMRAVFSLADGALPGSAESARVLRELRFTGPIYNHLEIGADERAWAPAEARQSGRPFTIGFVGALRPEKGVDDLARAVVRLHGDWRLVVVGDGPERNSITKILAAGGHEHRLDLKGLVDRDTLPQLMREFDVLVLPSRTTPAWREQFGVVLAEAMLSGVTVTGSDSGAIPEVIGGAGLIFPESDYQALADRLQLVANRPDYRRKLARLGRERALQLYSYSALADQTYSLYRKLLQGRADELRL
jgi:glycosyltransferase involved in cell wall biosynthesis